MNERIRELYEEAKSFYLTDEYILPPSKEDCELIGQKFAELIIQECGKVAYEETVHFPKPCDWLLDEFKRHFGVGVEATRKALAQPGQEPEKLSWADIGVTSLPLNHPEQEVVAWMHPLTKDVFATYGFTKSGCGVGQEPVPVYTAPPKQPKQEPVAWSVFDRRRGKHWYTNESKYTSQYYANLYSHRESDGSPSMVVTPLYTAPPKREWVGLEDEYFATVKNEFNRGALWAEQVLKERNT